MRTDQSRVVAWAWAMIVAAGCGGPAAEPVAEETSGGEEAPIVCSVPGAPAMEDYVAGVRLLRAGDASGMVSLERACEGGNPCACSAAGSSLESGEVVARDVDRGIALLERGCQGADAWGCYWLGAALFEHRADAVEHAAEAFATACDDDVPEACQGLGRFRMSGIGGSEDANEAVRLYESACTDGNVFACYFLGQAAAAGLGMEAPDATRARELLSWACEQARLPHACTALAELDTERRGDLLRTACDGGDPAACVAIDPPAPGDGTAAEALAIPAADAEAREIRTNEWETSGRQIGGDIDLSSLGLPPSCVGFVRRRPTQTIRVPAGVDAISFTASSDGDSVIAVRDASGRWTCGDDQPGGAYHARVTLTQPPPGVVAIWAGTLRAGEVAGGLAFTSEGVEVADAAFATPAGPQPVTIPATARTRFYKMRVVSQTGVTGTVRLDGHDLWGFGPDGGTIESDEGVQCALTAGQHTLEIVVSQRTRTAHGFDGGPLVELELHGFPAAGGAISDTSRLFRVQWSPPEAPQTRTTTFRLTRAQAADRAQCAAAAPAAPPASGG